MDLEYAMILRHGNLKVSISAELNLFFISKGRETKYLEKVASDDWNSSPTHSSCYLPDRQSSRWVKMFYKIIKKWH